MARLGHALLVALALVGPTSAVRVLEKAASRSGRESGDVTVSDLQQFFSQQLGAPDAQGWAQREQGYLTLCSLTVPKLQALKDEMFNRMEMSLTQVRTSILNLAYQQVSPQNLTSIYQALTRNVEVAKADAQANAMGLAMAHADPNLTVPLFQALQRMTVPKSQAQQLAIDLSSAGTNATLLEMMWRTYRYGSGMDQTSALNQAIIDAMNGYLGGLRKRYAKDGAAYTVSQFVDYYGGAWLAEWLSGVQEKRTAPDGVAYRALEWQQFFGALWESRYRSAPVAVQYKISPDGKTYPLSQFVTFYGQAQWQAEWRQSYEIIDPCASRDASTCTQQAGCQWRTTADRAFSWCTLPSLR